jgi:hypothetical protein
VVPNLVRLGGQIVLDDLVPVELWPRVLERHDRLQAGVLSLQRADRRCRGPNLSADCIVGRHQGSVGRT